MQNLKSVALPVPEITGGTRKNWAVPGYAHSPFSPKLFMGYQKTIIRMDVVIVLAKFEVRSLTHSEIIAIGDLGGVRTPILGKGRP